MNQKGTVPILFLIAAVGLLIFLFISNTFDFKDKLFGRLFPKPPSHAQEVSPSVPDEILLKFKPGVDEKTKDNIRKHFGVKKEEVIDKIDVERVKIPEKAKDKVIEALKHNPRVEYAEPNFINKAALIPNDTYFPQMWNLPKIAAPQGWDISTGTSSAVIAIIDSGVNLTHEDLVGKVSGTADDYGHGTQVAGVAAASSNNGKGVTGVCWLCPILSLKVLNSAGLGGDSSVAAGVTTAADNGARVINLSLGGYANSAAIQDAVNYAWNHGVVVVAAAGNDNTSTPFYPAANANVVAVGGSNPDDTKLSVSNYGPWLDVIAPGESILTTTMNGSYDLAGGTSFASPHVAGLAGLIFSAKSGLTNQQVVDIITSTALDLGVAGKDDLYGWGRIQADKALQKAVETTPPPPDTQAPTISVTSPASGSTVSGLVDITASASDNVGVTKVEFYVDGILFATDTTSPYLASWDTTTVSNGSHTLSAKAYDLAGNVGTSAAVTVTVNNPISTPTPAPTDTTPPSVSITNPSGTTVKAASKINITANALDNTGISKLEISVNGSIKCTFATNQTSYSCPWSVPGKKNIQYTISVKAYDASNNTGTASVTVKSQ